MLEITKRPKMRALKRRKQLIFREQAKLTLKINLQIVKGQKNVENLKNI